MLMERLEGNLVRQLGVLSPFIFSKLQTHGYNRIQQGGSSCYHASFDDILLWKAIHLMLFNVSLDKRPLKIPFYLNKMNSFSSSPQVVFTQVGHLAYGMADSLAKQGVVRSFSLFATIFIISYVSWYYHCTWRKVSFFRKIVVSLSFGVVEIFEMNSSLPTFLFKDKDFY